MAEETESNETEPSARKALYQGFGNALALAFEFVAIVGLGFLAGRWVGGTIGGAVGMILAWIGSTVRLYYRHTGIESPLAKVKATRVEESS
ncbi:MAG: hypothetical protein DCC49_06470 [Acidobacteria bacterium]|nr:MAG: hypothetical protein DCC49_06470 [Acidobacteriota bacterium]